MILSFPGILVEGTRRRVLVFGCFLCIYNPISAKIFIFGIDCVIILQIYKYFIYFTERNWLICCVISIFLSISTL